MKENDIRYTNKVLETETECDPFVLQWFWDVTRTPFNVIDVRNAYPYKIKALKNKILNNQFKDIKDFHQTWEQYIIENIMLEHQIDGIDKIFQIYSPLLKDNNVIIDVKATKGYKDRKTGLWVPTYGKLTMELYHRFTTLGDDETVHRLSWPWIKKENKTGWEDDLKYILYISELLAILIPKVSLNKVMTNPKYAYKFDLRDKQWEVNPRDTRDDRLVKNVRFNLGKQSDLNILLEGRAIFFLRNNAGIYVPFTPTIRSAETIKQNYFNSTSKK